MRVRARAEQTARRVLLDWLRIEVGLQAPGQRLEGFAGLDADGFVAGVRTWRPKAAGRLSPAGLQELRKAYAEHVPPVQARRAEELQLERRLADLVNQAYGLTPEDVALLWATAPPRTPPG